MNRRTLLKTGLLAGIATAVPLNIFAAQPENLQKDDDKQKGGFRRIKLGELDIFILSDGYLRDTDVASYAPRADVKELKNILMQNFRSPDYIDMGMNVPLIKTADRLILFDSGLGMFAGETAGNLLFSLRKAGFSADEVTDVFISHAHPDHIGGLTAADGSFVFKNAKYFIAKKEFDFWMKATRRDFRNSALYGKPEFLETITANIQKVLKILQPKTTYYDYSKTLYSHFNFIEAPGHTPGMTLLQATSGNETMLFVADLIHSDILLFPHPEWGFYGDADLDKAVASRKKILQMLTEKRLRAQGYHLPFPGTGHVKKASNSYSWLTEAYFGE